MQEFKEEGHKKDKISLRLWRLWDWSLQKPSFKRYLKPLLRDIYKAYNFSMFKKDLL